MLPVSAPLVLADEDRVARTAAEMIANRIRAGRAVRLLRVPPGLHSLLRVHARDGELPEPEEPAAEAPVELAVVGLDDDAPPLETLLAAREVLILAAGDDQAPAVRSLLHHPLLRAHPRLTVICDRAAAAELPPHRGGHHVCVVLGHREPSISAEHRISHESLGRLHRAEWIARRHPTLAAVLTGYTSTGGLSEAEQMRAAWRVADVPPLLEVAGRDTAENATRSLPLVLALGDARRVTVVTSAWHVRAPYHFRVWRDYGLEVRFAFDWHGDWGRMLVNEARGVRTMRRERRRALAEMVL